MHVGILGGTGPAGSGMAVRLASVGHEVTVGSRLKERAVEITDGLLATWPDRGLGLRAGDNGAAAEADVVIVATPWDAAATTASGLADALDGKIVISMANALIKVGGELQALALARGSVASGVQAALPGSRVAAAFHHLPAKELAELDHPVECDVLVCSDHPDALATASELATAIPGVRALDAGRLANALAVESFVAVLINLNVRYKARSAIRITGVAP